MSTENQSNPSTALAIARGEKLQTIRDEMTPGAKPTAIVPRTFAEVQAMCAALAGANIVPKAFRGNPADMVVVIMHGAELGIPPMAALRLFTTWDGVPRLMAEGVRAVVLTHPEIEYFEPQACSETSATWVGKRRGRPEKSATWTLERAKRAGLTTKPVWQAYPEDMLNARASMQLGRMIASDVIAGMVSLEEARDGDFIEASYTEQKAAQFVAPPEQPREVTQRFAVSGGIVEVSKPVDPPKRGPGRPPKEQTTASAPSPSSASSPTGTAQTSSPSASPTTSSAAAPSKLEEAIAKVEEKMEERKADPTSVAVPTAQTTSGVVAEIVNEHGDVVQNDAFGGEDPVDSPAPTDKLADFFAWLASCKTQRELQAGLQKWRTWSQDQAKAGDLSFAKDGENTKRMSEGYGKRKGEVPA